MIESTDWSLAVSTAVFVLATALILVFGVQLTRVAAQVAEVSRMGQTLVGALLLGATTSLPEVVTSLTAAVDGHANLAVSNAVGSVAGQTAFLAVADIAYRRANLEHAAASAENLLLAAVLIVLLAIVMAGVTLPTIALWNIHPVSLLLLVAYVQGMRMVSRVHSRPMWLPRRTHETADHRARDKPPTSKDAQISLPVLWAQFALAAAFTAVGGWLLARAAVPISVHTGLSQTVVGGLFTGLSGSLPELVTAVAAVRMGALSLAVGDILGGNSFDVLIVGLSDFLFSAGPIYGAVEPQQSFLMALTILLNAILLMGMLFREKHGVANIGFESMLSLVFYVGGMLLLTLSG